MFFLFLAGDGSYFAAMVYIGYFFLCILQIISILGGDKSPILVNKHKSIHTKWMKFEMFDKQILYYWAKLSIYHYLTPFFRTGCFDCRLWIHLLSIYWCCYYWWTIADQKPLRKEREGTRIPKHHSFFRLSGRYSIWCICSNEVIIKHTTYIFAEMIYILHSKMNSVGNAYSERKWNLFKKNANCVWRKIFQQNKLLSLNWLSTVLVDIVRFA